jgi:radical SAM family uncharacterized protein/radical SAM-linked protein
MTRQSHFAAISKPGRYLGHEYNSAQKNWDRDLVRFALVFPDLYEIGMSHHGLQILYHLLNSQKEMLAERCFCPDIDLEHLLRLHKEELTSLESSKPLHAFDCIGITLPYELCYSNILTILDLADIPLYSRDRDTTFPLVLGGGAGAFNPEPVADYFDAILLGDGEEAIVEIGQTLLLGKTAGWSKPELLEKLGDIEGVYIPAHFQPEQDALGNIVTIRPTAGITATVRRRFIKDLSATDHLWRPIVPNAKIVHDRLGIEVARGCTRGCRFCQAGITYRPVRERSPEQIMELAQKGIDNSGFEELALLSLSTGDYSCLEQTLPALMDKFSSRFISVAMPSMRVGTLSPAIMEQVKRVRKTGFTLAPEAGSERLRRVINKGITEEDLLATCNDAFAAGWQSIKLYFMIGLPTETDEDIVAIADLARKILNDRGKSGGRGKRQITISIGTFIPKPHTPFQWARQLTMEESMERIHHLKRILPGKGCNLRYHSPRQSYLEGVFSRGDRRLAVLIEQAWKNGARLDGWDEHFNLDRWQKAADDCHLSLDWYLQSRSTQNPLPWDHLSTGVAPQFLLDELEKSNHETYTPDCRYHACQKCGLCDFKTLQPVVCNRGIQALAPPLPVNKEKEDEQSGHAQMTGHFKYIVHYSRLGNICYLGHLEMLQGIFRTLRRAEIKTNFSQGFNPSPKISFGPALAAGTESLAEFFIMDLPAPLPDCSATTAKLNEKLVPGLHITKIAPHSGKVPQSLLTAYTLTLARPITQEEQDRAAHFLASSAFAVSKTRKGKTSEIDIRPLITLLRISEPCTVHLEMITVVALPGIKPLEALTQILGLNQEDALATSILKTGWQTLDNT